MAELVELHPASFWDCPECGKENFIRHFIEEKPQDGNATDIVCQETDDEGHEYVYPIPQAVKCIHCDCMFVTKDYEDNILRDEDDSSEENEPDDDTEV